MRQRETERQREEEEESLSDVRRRLRQKLGHKGAVREPWGDT